MARLMRESPKKRKEREEKRLGPHGTSLAKAITGNGDGKQSNEEGKACHDEMKKIEMRWMRDNQSKLIWTFSFMLIVLLESKPTCGQPWLIYWESLVNPKIWELNLLVVLLETWSLNLKHSHFFVGWGTTKYCSCGPSDAQNNLY